MISSLSIKEPLAGLNVLGEPEMIPVPGGSFLMGGIDEDKFVSAVELPRHPVDITLSYEIGAKPITCREWSAAMGSLPDGNMAMHDENLPVVKVTFQEVMAYLREISSTFGKVYRLPSEAEWEHACRAGSATVFPHAGALGPADANFLYNENGAEVGTGRLMPVGSFPANAFGIHDMLGNVCEWTADRWHPSYNDAPTDGSAWISGGKAKCRTIRGGAWDHLPRVLRASWRDWAPEQARWDNLGFRIALTL